MAHKLFARLEKLEDKKPSQVVYPNTLDFFYMSQEDQRHWFEKNNPSYSYDEYLKCSGALELKLQCNHIN